MRKFVLGLGASVLLATNAFASEWTIPDAVDATITDAIIPMLIEYEGATEDAVNIIAPLCEAPSEENLAAARASFKNAAKAWGAAEFIRIGPLSAENRLERTLYWPDRKGRGLRQVQAAIATEQEEVTTSESVGGQSVAVQGFLALDFILFGTDSDALATGSPHRCSYALAVTQNLNSIANELLADWTAGDGIASLWRNPSADNPLFRDDTEQLRTLVKLIGDGAEVVLVQRLDPFLSTDPVNHKRALYWRSGSTIAALQGNVAGLQRISDAARLPDLIREDRRRIVQGIDFELLQAARVLDGLDRPVEEIAVDEEALGRARYVRIAVNSVFNLAGTQVPAAFGLTAGFSTLDGD